MGHFPSHRGGCAPQDHHPQGRGSARDDPPRRRACPRHGGAGALSRHPGHHRPGHRYRLLLRLRARDPVHAGRSRQDRSQDARDRQSRSADASRSVAARQGDRAFRSDGRDLQGRTHPQHSGGRRSLDLLPRRMARSVPRSAFRVDFEDRQRVQADEDRRRLLARGFQQSHASAHLRHRVARRERTRGLSDAAGRAGKTRSPPHRQGSRTFHLLAGRRRGTAAVDAERHGDPPGARIPRAAGRAQGRLSSRGHAAHREGSALLSFAPPALLQRGHVFAARYRRRELLPAADELPASSPDLRCDAAFLSRDADPHRGIRTGLSLRSVGRIVRA